MSRTSVVISTREGTLLTAPGNTSQMPTVPTVSIAPDGFGRRFERENQFGGRCQRILAARHKLSAGVSAFAFDHDTLAGGRGNVRHQADVELFLLEIGALLDVQLDKLMEAASRHGNGFRRTGEPRLRAQFFQSAAILVAQSERLFGREYSGHHAATQAANAESRRLFGGEDDEFDGPPRLESELLQNANGLKTAKHSHTAVVEAGIGNSVDVRTGANRRERRSRCPPIARRYCRPRLRER